MKTRFMAIATVMFTLVFLIFTSSQLYAEDCYRESNPPLSKDPVFLRILDNLRQAFLNFDTEQAKKIARQTPEKYACAVTEIVIAHMCQCQRSIPVSSLLLAPAQVEKIQSYAAAYDFFGGRYTNPQEDYQARLNLSVEHRYLNGIAQVLNVFFYEQGQQAKIEQLLFFEFIMDNPSVLTEIPEAIVPVTQGIVLPRYVLSYLGDQLANDQLPCNVRLASLEGLERLAQSPNECVREPAMRKLLAAKSAASLRHCLFK